MEVAMEMDRGVHPTPSASTTLVKSPFLDSSRPSLQTRLKEHFRMRQPHLFMPEIIERVAVPVYLFTITSAWYLGMFQVTPSLHKNSADHSAILFERSIMLFLYFEMMANWICVRYLDSSYFAYLKSRFCQNVPVRERNFSNDDATKNGIHSFAINIDPGQFTGENGIVSGDAMDNGFGEIQSCLQEKIDGRILREDNGSKEFPWKPSFRPPQQTTYPYWSWAPCYICRVMRPPRCHHCPTCQVCVLKRHHHCFFSGSCVGWRNQRHFLVFTFWALIGCSYVTFNALQYFAIELWPLMNWYDTIAPLCFVSWLLGKVPGFLCFCVNVQTLVLYFNLLTFWLLYRHLLLVVKGLTAFEVTNLKKTIELRDTRGLMGKIRSVMGKYWLLNFVLPLHWLLEMEEHPLDWPCIKVYRH